MKARFNHDANTLEEAREYLLYRAEQLLIDNIKFVRFEPVHRIFPGVVTAIYKDNTYNIEYAAHYVLKDFRGKSLYPVVYRHVGKPIITFWDCHLTTYLSNNRIPYKIASNFLNTREYEAIEKHYGSIKARRSGIHYMNHIDEGLALLRYINSSDNACRAFCLHPMLQIDSDFQRYYATYVTDNPWVMALAVEYRNVANAYLSPMGKRKVEDIQLSPIKEVNEMLVADKIQNRKDFEAHKEKYGNAAELDYYFRAWLERLDVSELTYQYLKERITINGS